MARPQSAGVALLDARFAALAMASNPGIEQGPRASNAISNARTARMRNRAPGAIKSSYAG
jgi:hypothetical protein